MKDKYIEIKIKIDINDYEMLENISLDMSVEKYLEKYLRNRLFKHNDKEKTNPLFDEFSKLKENLNRFNIRQDDIASYLKVSQTSVSTFLRKENRKSHLYPKFFIHPTSKGLIYNIYIYKYNHLFLNTFSLDEQAAIKHTFNNLHKDVNNENRQTLVEDINETTIDSTILQNFHDEEIREDIYYEENPSIKKLYEQNMLIIASILSVKLKKDFPAFNVDEFIDLAIKYAKEICLIKHEAMNNKDLDYINDKTSYIYELMSPFIAF